MEPVRSREVCFHWKRGNCFKGDSCRFSHVGRQNNAGSAQNTRSTQRVALCKNGSSCDWLAKGNCSYFHPRVGVQKPWTNREGGQNSRQERETQPQRQQPFRNQTQRGQGRIIQPDRPACKYDGRCEAIPNCPNIHSLQVFPLFQGRRTPWEMRNQNRRRN